MRLLGWIRLKWLKITKRYQCPYEVAHILWSMSLTPYGGIVRGGYIGQFNKQPGCYDTADAIAWLVLTDSLGQRSPDDTVTYPMIVEPVIYGDSGVSVRKPDGQHMDWRIYPNPTKDKVYLELLNPQAKLSLIEIQLYDYTGRRLLRREMEAYKEIIDLTAYPSGMYFIRMRKDDQDIGGTKVTKW